MHDIIDLTRDLCSFRTGVVADGNEAMFGRLAQELPLRLNRYPSGSKHNGWVVPQNWRVRRAEIRRDGRLVFDGRVNALGVAYYSKSFSGRLDWETLQTHLITNPTLPDAFVFHCIWQYRPWAADWVMSVPYDVYRTLGPGTYEIDLSTEYEPGEMIVGECHLQGETDNTIVFHSNNCHPHMANDGFAGTAVMVRLFQWLQETQRRHSYRLIVGPEHVGTIFYLANMPPTELNKIVCGVFGEMMGNDGPFKVAATFLGDQPIDKAFHNVVKHHAKKPEFVGWRMSAGNDETVWEAPGYEVPFLQVNRSVDRHHHFTGYHTSLDGPDLVKPEMLEEFLDIFKRVVAVLEGNAAITRRFRGLICLSSPDYGLYFERPDPAVSKNLAADSEKWGYLQDCLPRYFDGQTTILDIAEKHDLPFERLRAYLEQLAEKGLIELNFLPVKRTPSSIP